jgi:hypothetical protein
LAFQVYSRPIHPELFEILAHRRVQREDYEVAVSITRTGHVITWTHPRVTLTEVAASESMLPAHRRLLRLRLRGEHCSRLTPSDHVAYQNTFQVEVLSPEVFVHVHDEIVADGGKRGLLHPLQSSNRWALSPLGFVTVEARPGCLFLTAFHTFPDEFAVVKTQSLIEMRR